MLLGKSLWGAVENAIEVDECYCVPNHSIINTASGQELGRQKDVQSGISDSADRTAMNEAMGEQYARRLGQLYSSDNYSSYSETFASSLQNSSIVAQGTASANQVGDANVVYRQLHPKEVAAIHSLSDQLAQKTGMSSDKAEKLLAQVAAGRVDEKWSEVYQLDDASIGDDVAAANELLDGFAEAQGKELLKDDDVVANWFSEDPESDVYKDTSLFSENLTSGVEVNNPGGYPQSEAAGPVARNPEYLNFYKQNLEVAVADTYQGKLTAEQLSAMKAGATQSLDDMVDAVKQLPEVAAFAASHPVLFGKAMAKAYTQMLTDNQRDTGEMLALRMMGKNEEAQQVGAKHVGEMLTNIALGLGGEAAATKAVEAIGKVTKAVKVVSTEGKVVAPVVKNESSLLNESSSLSRSSVPNNLPVLTAINNSVRLVDQDTLPRGIQRTFLDGNYVTVETTTPVVLFRKFGGTGNQAKANGGFASTTPNASRSETAVFKRWSNQRFEAQLDIPEGTTLNIGKVAPQTSKSGNRIYHKGGADQILLPQEYPISWISAIKDGKTGITYTLDEFRNLFPDQFK
ncbi:hypothetical protein [Vibrio gazogenes]|uniref:Uncharacterized protein n=1 Tax=Vibrio gazogenes TaxID=687 RepID=A0A1Z2SL49_VIBGA|nr:hypothetical protein [Vibrio gazogenes]ASA57921.1 hypothetical protein BSQ33_19620 [Vibrio gazogenes]